MLDDALAYFATPGRFTTLAEGEYCSADVLQVVDVVQGLLLYDVVSEPFYGVTLPPVQADTIHERRTDRVIEVVKAVDPRPIAEARPLASRVGARCHLFTRLTVALLRAAGVPARSRCGFGAYFRPGWFEDHWVAEYWNDVDQRWVMVDAQLDDVWRERIGFTGNRFDMRADEFVTAGHAWQAWRSGELDAGRCGLSAINEHGAFWIASNLRLDFAALNKTEMLPWDLWGAGWEPGTEPTPEMLALFDEVAALTVDPDRQFHEVRRRYDADASLRMDGTVFSVARGCVETV